MRARCACLLLSVVAMLASPALAAEPKFPVLSGRVVDDANILNPSTTMELRGMLADHERATGEQVVVVTLDSLQGYSIETYGYQLGRHWGIGQKGKNNGAILIVAPKERKVRIEVGYGLEGTLTDAISRVIIDRSIVPYFRTGDFNTGVRAGVISILRVLGGNPTETAEQPASPVTRQLNPAASVGVQPKPTPVYMSRRAEWTILMLYPAMVIFWGLLFFLFQRSGGRSGNWNDGSSGGSSFGGSSSGGGSSGGDGGFSGGGGSFGGGGASGSW
jgi:uncharacterized protein